MYILDHLNDISPESMVLVNRAEAVIADCREIDAQLQESIRQSWALQEKTREVRRDLSEYYKKTAMFATGSRAHSTNRLWAKPDTVNRPSKSVHNVREML
jgi:hypothetical protein